VLGDAYFLFKECLRACANIFDKSKTKLKPTVTITRNGRFIIHLDWLDTVLADNDNVRILTLHSGG